MISDHQRFDLDQVVLLFHREFISRIYLKISFWREICLFIPIVLYDRYTHIEIFVLFFFLSRILMLLTINIFVPSWQAINHKSTKHNHKYTIFNELSSFPNKRNPRHWEFKTSFQLLETLLLANPCLFHCISHIFLVFRQIIPD